MVQWLVCLALNLQANPSPSSHCASQPGVYLPFFDWSRNVYLGNLGNVYCGNLDVLLALCPKAIIS